ncbi:thiamine pyrophosphate-dependent enzyme [Shewanella surugensis]|uniref:Thiamine pyrophosphate-dependent enzyme n=1 Tax=Shewanella surugensis TaxID=212020 RepID=A0ABT0LEF3_9GAMM|nr:thiamine pyrophosphate-dependent enzyme [Shewanella surugensis]MCL1125865.1 thiamine pyrophosphate-dependent enzyme [Shewanella surugensis]
MLIGAKNIAEKIKTKLSAAKKPVLFLGMKAKLNPKLLSLIQSFCEKYHIPYVTSWLAKGILDEYHPLSLGAYNGVFSATNIHSYIEQEVDYVLEVATSINQLDTNIAFATGTHLLFDFKNKTVLKGTDQLEQDIISTFEYLLETSIAPFHFEAPALKQAIYSADERIDFHNLTSVLNQLQQQNDQAYVYFPEIGNSYFASYSLRTRMSSLGRSWLTNPWYAAMGASLPYARSACRKLVEQQSNDVAVVITGDGGFNFQLNDLIHFLRDDLNVIIIYMRNDIFHLGKNSDADIYHCSDKKFDVISLVKAFGGEGKRCTTVGEFSEYFDRCARENRHIKLIEVPAITEDQYQCREIRLLNLYIKAKNGVAEAVQEWQAMINNQD